MIRIDLLPPEYRKAERTAPAKFLATVGLVALFCSAAAACGYGWFGVVGGARSEVLMAQEILDSKQPQADYADRLEKEKKDYSERMDHIKKFSDSRILWTKKLDQLCSLVDAPDHPDKYMIWLDSLAVRMNGARDIGLKMTGHSATGRMDRLASFNKDLRKGEFFKDFESITPPSGKLVTDEEFDPSSAFEFETALLLKNLTGGDDSKKSAKTARKK